MNIYEKNISGKHVIPYLAEIYQQLYLEPGEKGEEEYPLIVRQGKDASKKTLAHFRMTDGDSCHYEATPAGEVRVVTLCDRHDFETFLQIMGEACRKVPIPATQGAVILDGVVNHQRIEEHRKAFYQAAEDAGKPEPGFFEWLAERSEFTADKSNYTDALIVLSIGPYSGLPAEKAGYEKEEWLKLSQTIRTVHECTHFVCRRLYPKQTDPVWDELVADAAGIYAALGSYDIPLAENVLGIRDGVYMGGRLENYVDPEKESVVELAARISPVLRWFGKLEKDTAPETGYAFALTLMENKETCKEAL